MLRRCFKLFSSLPVTVEKPSGKLTVLLDMDETLCYCFYPTDHAGFMYQPDIQEDAIVDFPEQRTVLYIYKRPHLDEFLEHLGEHYDPVLYSSGIPEYTNIVANIIDPKGICRTRYSQLDCTYERAYNYPQFEWVKDLSKLKENPGRSVVVDDDWKGMLKQPDNYLTIEKWEAWYDDDHLMTQLLPALEELRDLPDVRPFIRAKYMHKYMWADQGRICKLSEEDNEFARFMVFEESLDYEKIYEKYMEVFINPTVFTEAMMW